MARFSVLVDPELKASLQRIADREDRTLTSVVRLMLRDGVRRWESGEVIISETQIQR